MKILVTGAAGFAGSYLLEALRVDPDNELVGLYLSNETSDEPKIKWIKGDLLDSDAMYKIINSVKPDAVYHLAAYSSPQNSFKHPRAAINQTTAMQINLFEACLKADIAPRVLLASSGLIYSPKNPLPISELGEVDCSSPYAVAKYTQENIADYYLKRGFPIIIARAFNHIGPRQKLGFLVSDLAHQIAKAENTTNSIIKVGNLVSKRDFTDVRDVASAYIKLLGKGQSSEVYNICSGRSVSGQSILDSLLKMAKSNIATELDPERMRPSDVPDLYGDHTKITKATGWQPKIKLNQTLNDTLNYWRQKISEELS